MMFDPTLGDLQDHLMEDASVTNLCGDHAQVLLHVQKYDGDSTSVNDRGVSHLSS